MNRKKLRSAISTLKKARKLISDPDNWIKGAYQMPKGYDKKGKMLYAYCSLGAIRAADGPGEVDAQLALGQAIRPSLKHPGFGSIITFNDSKKRKHEEVLSKFDLAISNLEAQLSEIE